MARLFIGLLLFAFTLPSSGAISTGYYSRGQLRDAAVLPLEGDGFIKIFQRRKAFFGATETVELVKSVASALKAKYLSKDRMQVADLSGQHGGYLAGHGSHQNGLDVDIAYFRKDQTEQDPKFDQGATSGFKEVFVKNGVVSANFDVERNWELVRLLVASGKVQRVFVDPAIKAKFCSYLRARGTLHSFQDTILRVRLEDLHEEHMHVRLPCPAGNTECKGQADVGNDIGC